MSPKHDDLDTVPERMGKPRQEPETVTEVGGAVTTEPPPVGEPLRAVPGGYTLVELLGRGGMGEVVLAADDQIGREVAIKRMRDTPAPEPDAELRFFREAKIQARLQHPAIVPVHEVGRDVSGRPYFTMQRLAGTTLDQLIGTERTPQRLLRAFAEICLAVEYAHEHGVVHRDIKPSNIMLGDFGEVYLLDWGVARVLAETAGSESVTDIAVEGGETQVGSVLGTPGYMAPEQALGYALGPKIDVYALGCVLFEILAGQPLHPRGTGGAANAIAHPTEAPSSRRPDRAIAPELDAACVAALAGDPDGRPSARELGQLVQRYLDGDRDLERRRSLAAEQLAEARAALTSNDAARRGDAVHAAGRALALDPESVAAADLVTQLIVEPPTAMPPALVDSLRDAERASYRVRARAAMFGFVSVLSFVVIVPFVDVTSWPQLSAFFAAVLGMAIVTGLAYRRGSPIVAVSLLATLILTITISRIASPFVLTPVVIAGVATAFYAIPWLLQRAWIVHTWVIAAMVIPFACEQLGLVRETWTFDGDTMLIRSAVLHPTNPTFAGIALLLVNVVFVGLVGSFARASSRDRWAAETRLHVQGWHLRQLLPHGTRGLSPGR